MVAERCGELARADAAKTVTAESGDTSDAGTEGENALQTLCWGSLAIGGLMGSAIGMAAATQAGGSSAHQRVCVAVSGEPKGSKMTSE